MFARKTGAYINGASPSLGRLLTLLTNIRLGLIGLPEKISLAYNEDLIMTAIKSIIALAPGCR
jgi:hypothetical protein